MIRNCTPDHNSGYSASVSCDKAFWKAGFAVRGILYKGTLAHSLRCSRRRRIDEADISTPVTVDQRVANCLGKLYSYSPPCGAVVDRSALASPSIVHCQIFESFGARRSTASKLVSLWNCFVAYELLLRCRKTFLLEGR